jgi:hypothetical protein
VTSVELRPNDAYPNTPDQFQVFLGERFLGHVYKERTAHWWTAQSWGHGRSFHDTKKEALNWVLTVNGVAT